jgi:uncharacterized protein (TIGR03437 family)
MHKICQNNLINLLKIALGVALAAFAPAQILQAQQSILGTNLIVNGDAEAGSAGTGLGNVVASIPGWTGTGHPNVLPYGLTGLVLLTSPAPPTHGFNYFASGPSTVGLTSTLTQVIDVSSGAAVISAGNIKYTLAGWLGITNFGGAPPTVNVAFQNANGQTFSTATLTLPGALANSLFLQQQMGLVPAGTSRITVTLTVVTQCENAATCGYGVADSLSLTLSTLGTDPASLLGANLVTNGGAEAGTGIPNPGIAPNVPGWSTDSGASVSPYGGYTGFIKATDPGPSDRGTNLFYGGPVAGNSHMYQDIDVTAASSLIDTGQVQFELSAWLGALAGHQSAMLTCTFYDWTGKTLAPPTQLGPFGVSVTSLTEQSQLANLPAGTRVVHIALTFHFGENAADTGGSLADDISFIIGQLGAPIVIPGGIVPVYSSVGTIQAGSWISIYGTGLASSAALWNGDFPTQLGGTTVTIGGKAAYLWFVSLTQINAQAPDDIGTGSVPVVVTTSAGTSTSTVIVSQYAPSFSLFNGKYAAAIVPTTTPGNSGNGYDVIGPAGAFSFPSRPVKAGETVLLYGVGFGPTTQPAPAGSAFSGAAPCITLPTVTIGGVSAEVSFAGIVEAGLYQFNVIVPNAGSGDKALSASVGGVLTPSNVFITLQ